MRASDIVGDVAQLVERVLSMHEVWGSIPHFSKSLGTRGNYRVSLYHLEFFFHQTPNYCSPAFLASLSFLNVCVISKIQNTSSDC
jgi:hypothetical protein